MKRTFLFVLLLICSIYTFSQQDSIHQRIFLIGDAGEMPGTTHPVIAWLKKNADWNDVKNTVIYLGDNIYPLGMPMVGDPSYAEAKRILDDQISLVKGKKARGIFIPGNHDWKNGKLGGWQQIMNQINYINGLEQKNIQAWPINGCPGPVQVELTDKIIIAIIDTEWFLYLHDKPGPGSDCDAKTLDEFQIELKEIANTHPNQLLIVAMHHPIYSYGTHGGDYTFREHLFPFTALKPNLYIPLPVIGSLYPLARGVFGSIQDIPHPLYWTMSRSIMEAIKKHPNTIVVTGHDHGLQLIKRDSIPHIISGSGSLLTKIRPGRFSIFSDVELGFSMIEVWKSGKIDVKFYNLNSPDLDHPTFSNELKSIVPPPLQAIDTTRIILDSVVVASASTKLKGSGVQHFLLGKNYREEWLEPLRLPVLDMGKEQGGLTPIRQSGGLQFKSLRVQDKSGKEWDLRSVIKYPTSVIPPDLYLAPEPNKVADGLSASYPFGALSMGVFSNAVNVPWQRNKLVYLPDDPRLTRFRSTFKNTVAIMEEREPKNVKTADNTDEMILKLTKDNNVHVDQKAVLRARLLDNFVMDFDRGDAGWQWTTYDTGRVKLYFPIPVSRDEAFFTNQGIIPALVRKPWMVPELQGFRAKTKNIKTFNGAVRHFDRTFLTSLDQKDWREEIDQFLNSMTDSVIETAMRQQPYNLQSKNMQSIIHTLKERRTYFKDEMIEYYRFISRKVSIVGTNAVDIFHVIKNSDGTVRIIINKTNPDSSVGDVVYNRLFTRKETREIRLFGMAGNDQFIVEGGNSPIEIRIVGGAGNDEFINNGNGGKIRVYDVNFEDNKFIGNPGLTHRISVDPQVNAYDRLNFKYDYVRPGLAVAYTKDDGLFIGPKLEIVTQGFRKDPYSTRHFILAERAIKSRSYHFVLNSDYIHVLGNYDIAVRSDFRAPDNETNFFGIGNNTVRNTSVNDVIQYYRANYNVINASAYFRRQLQSWMRIYFGPSFQMIGMDSAKNFNHYINTFTNSIDQADLYKKKTYGGLDTRLEINSKNSDAIPTRGATLDAGIRSLFGLNRYSSNVTQLNIDLRIFMSLATQRSLVLATRFGWGKNIGHYEFQQAQYLGGNDNLRGFRKQRFAGRSMLYNNTDLRIKLADFTTYLFPGAMGIYFFNDVGRVFADEKSYTWHDGYGGGLWLAPIKRYVMTFSLAHSVEEKLLPRFTIGFEF